MDGLPIHHNENVRTAEPLEGAVSLSERENSPIHCSGSGDHFVDAEPVNTSKTESMPANAMERSNKGTRTAELSVGAVSLSERENSPTHCSGSGDHFVDAEPVNTSKTGNVLTDAIDFLSFPNVDIIQGLKKINASLEKKGSGTSDAQAELSKCIAQLEERDSEASSFAKALKSFNDEFRSLVEEAHSSLGRATERCSELQYRYTWLHAAAKKDHTEPQAVTQVHDGSFRRKLSQFVQNLTGKDGPSNAAAHGTLKMNRGNKLSSTQVARSNSSGPTGPTTRGRVYSPPRSVLHGTMSTSCEDGRFPSSGIVKPPSPARAGGRNYSRHPPITRSVSSIALLSSSPIKSGSRSRLSTGHIETIGESDLSPNSSILDEGAQSDPPPSFELGCPKDSTSPTKKSSLHGSLSSLLTLNSDSEPTLPEAHAESIPPPPIGKEEGKEVSPSDSIAVSSGAIPAQSLVPHYSLQPKVYAPNRSTDSRRSSFSSQRYPSVEEGNYTGSRSKVGRSLSFSGGKSARVKEESYTEL